MRLHGKRILVMGIANKKSVAYHTAKLLEQAGAEVVYSVRSEARREKLAPLVGNATIVCCDVAQAADIEQLAKHFIDRNERLDGLVHSIAFADYSDGIQPFHATGREQFLQAMDISCFSLTAICHALREVLQPDASVVTISISTTRMASESYGYMAPIKAALDSSLAFLTKSFSRFSRVRFNAVAAGLLKTSASAGIPGYVDSYLFAEQVIPRKKAVQTEEVAATALFLVSPLSSGITAQQIVVDAGMSINYFDAEIVKRVMQAP
jgi:enoyl-[acyl-carrier protein] reductase I